MSELKPTLCDKIKDLKTDDFDTQIIDILTSKDAIIMLLGQLMIKNPDLNGIQIKKALEYHGFRYKKVVIFL